MTDVVGFVGKNYFIIMEENGKFSMISKDKEVCLSYDKLNQDKVVMIMNQRTSEDVEAAKLL